jgi:hypothetical protein
MPTADAFLEASHKQQLEGKIPPPTAEEFLTSYCLARGMLAAASGVPDFQRASRIVIKEYADGKLLYCHPPPKYDAETFHKETLLLALQKTKKLREKLLQRSINNSNKVVQNSDDESSTATDQDMDDDALLLEMMGGTMPSSDATAKNQKPTRKKKWGKKGRKVMNKDPYGMFSSPDDLLGEGTNDPTPLGVTVKGGKKHSCKGYTRQTGYGGVRASS